MKSMNEILLNSTLKWDLTRQPHATITGKTGSGKTQFLYYLILEAANLTNKIYVLDGKGGDLTNLNSVNVFQTTDQITSAFEELLLIMRARIDLIKSKNLGNRTASEIGLPHVFCFIDELAAIMINAHKLDRKNKAANRGKTRDKTWDKLKEDSAADIIDSVTELILVARQASIHLVLAAQHFDAKLLDDSAVRSNIGMKVLLGQQTPQEYNMMSLTQDQLPNVDFSTVGSGVIMLDGLGWLNARPFETPYITFNHCTPNQVLSDRIKQFSPD